MFSAEKRGGGIRQRHQMADSKHQNGRDEAAQPLNIEANGGDGHLDLPPKKQVDELRFWHWTGYTIWILAIFLTVYFLDRRLPSVVSKTDYSRFSEVRAKEFLRELTEMGPRPSGSDVLENKTLDLMLDRLAVLETMFSQTNSNYLELDVQHPSGCFNVDFLNPFSLCYDDITNIVVRISSKPNSTQPALLLNCHMDSVPPAPGATDDAIGCAIYLDFLEVLAHRKEPLKNDLIVLFNAAEENFMQGAHGFVSQHKWRNQPHSFINLEGTGSGGREILFQATKKDPWILEAYLQHAKHPHCNIIAQELFQSGIIPSETDFRILRDFGKLSGLDIAYYKNGWVYHTEFDKVDVIDEGAIQRGGENLIAVAEAILQSPNLQQSNSSVDTKWIFYDIVGLFTISYRAVVGLIINCVACLLTGILVFLHLSRWRYRLSTLLYAFVHHLAALVAMLLVGGIIVGCVYLFGMTMCWYATPILVFFIYIFPMMAVGFWVHSVFVCRERGDRVKARMDYKFLQNRIYRLSETLHLDTESAHYDATLIIYSVFLLLMTIFGILSAYIFMIVVVFGLLREPILFAYEKITKKDLSSQIIFIVQTICLSPAFFLLSYCANLFIGFFIPVMGRFGNSLLPELFIMPLALVISLLFVLLTANLVYLTRPCSLLFKIVLAFYLLIFVIIISTRIGNPYKWRNDGSPRLRRLIAIHTKRTAYEYDGRIKSSDVGMFYQSMDYRGVGDLPKHSLFNGSRPDCSQFSDAYCQLPYYTPVLSMMPWEKSSWVQTNDEPSIKSPFKIELLDRHSIDDSKFGQHINFSISVKGGMDKMQLHLTPLRGYKLKALSFIQLDLEKKVDDSYFVFWTYGYKAPEERRFWNNTEIKETNKSASLEIVAVTHQVHGPYQQSKSLSELQNKIVEQRTSDWKWGITLTYGTSEVVSNLF